MKQIIEATLDANGQLMPKHEIDQLCAACGYDLTAEELQAATCADCGAPLEVKQNATVHVMAMPVFGSVNM